MPRLAARLLLSIGSVLLTVAIVAGVEFGLEIFDVAPAPDNDAIRFDGAIRGAEDAIVWDRDRLYRFRGGLDLLGTYRTNSRGYRGAEFSDSKLPGTYRIVCVGDSCVFGLGLREQDTIARRLQFALERAFEGAGRFEVLDLGVVGYSTFQSTRHIETEIGRLEPNLVIYMPTAFNDATLAPDASDEERAERNAGFTAWLLHRRLVRLLGFAQDRVDLPERIELASGQDPSRCRVPISDIERLAKRAFSAIDAAGAEALLAMPTVDESLAQRDSSLEARLAIFERVARERGAIVAPVNEALRAYRPVSVFLDGVHPDRVGVVSIVRTMFRSIVESDAIPESPRREFLRTFLKQSRSGCFSHPDIDNSFRFGAPDEVIAWSRLARRGSDSSIAAEEEEWFSRFDPILGSRRSAYGVGRALILSQLGIVDEAVAPSPTARDAWVAEVERHVWPRDLFARHLWGEIGVGGAPSEDAIARARATTIYEHRLGLAEIPRDRRLGVASRAAAAGDVATFLAALERVVGLNPMEHEARVMRARARRAAGQSDLALHEVEDVLRVDPDDAGALAVAALIALDEQDPPRARPLLERAIAADPFAVDCRFGLARLLLAAGDRARARTELSVVLAIDPSAYPEARGMWESLTED